MDHTRKLVHHVLSNASAHKWSLQGLGMLRTYVGEDLRIHVWSNKHQVRNVSLIHTHPWNFHSTVMSGQISDTTYTETSGPVYPVMRQQIRCGEGGGLCGAPTRTHLRAVFGRTYQEGEQYVLHANDIHTSTFMDGTVTIIKRTFLDDVDHASVYWPVGKEWVSAEPRMATPDEVADIVGVALENWA